jgi:hypothetical protein
MVFIATFSNSSVKYVASVLFAEETDVPGENNRPVANHCQTQSHNAVSSIPRHLLAIVEVICTDCMHR